MIAQGPDWEVGKAKMGTLAFPYRMLLPSWVPPIEAVWLLGICSSRNLTVSTAGLMNI